MRARRLILWTVLAAFLLATILVAVRLWPAANSGSAGQDVRCPAALLSSRAAPVAPAGVNATGGLAAPPLYLGLDAYRHLDKLAYLELGDRVEGGSTADTGGSNSDSVHTLRSLPGGGNVLFDQLGPGIVTFMRMQENYGNPWQLSLDGQAIPAIQPGDLGQVNPSSAPASAWPYPLSLDPQESQGSSIVATGLPFQQRLVWSSQRPNGNFYALYRKLPYGSPLPSWNSGSPAGDVVALLRCAGSDIAPQGLSQRQGTLTLATGRETSVVTLAGPAQLRALSFQVPASEMVSLGDSRLRIYWDGKSQPDVDAPLKFLAGDGAGVYAPQGRPLVQGLMAGAQQLSNGAMRFNLYWPMPFSSRARITLVSGAPLSNISWSASYEPFPDPPQWWGTFHATYTNIPRPQPGQDMTFLDVRGSGKLVGTVINFTAPDGTLEGDPHIYLDDSQTPQIAGTGTEEWGLGGDYWNGGRQVSLPLGGLPSSVNNRQGTDIDGAALYRFLIADSIPFNRHLLVRWEHGGSDQSTHPYRAVMLWYGNPVQTAQPSDELLPASSASRLAHDYSATGESAYRLTAAYEYTAQSPLISADGTRTSGSASFTMKLDPRNLGAYLRRTFDDCIANQRANVYLDGVFAGTWYDAGISTTNGAGIDGHRRCWRDEDFPLPASLTAGKSSVHVHIAFVPTNDPPDSSWTAFRYEMYSFVLV